METTHRITHHAVPDVIPRLVHLFKVPALGVIETWRYVYMVKQLECSAYRNIMLYTIIPILQQIRLQEFILLCRYAITELSAVRQRNLFIPTFVALAFFAFKGILLRQRHIKAWQIQRNDGIPYIL